QEAVGHLHQDACPIARVRFATARAAMVEVSENLECVRDDRVGFSAFDVNHETDPASVMFESGIVKASSARGATTGLRGSVWLGGAIAHLSGCDGNRSRSLSVGLLLKGQGGATVHSENLH